METDYLRPPYLFLLERAAEIQESTIKPHFYASCPAARMSRRHSTERLEILVATLEEEYRSR